MMPRHVADDASPRPLLVSPPLASALLSCLTVVTKGSRGLGIGWCMLV
jgi:hypothetical protein